jgi:HK97 family phage major capsid protein
MTNEAKIVDALGRIVDVQATLASGRKHLTPGELVAKSDLSGFKTGADLATIEVPMREIKTAILGSGAINDVLAPSMQPAIDPGARRTLTVRSLLTTSPTSNAAIEMPTKASTTPGSPIMQPGEGSAMGEGGVTFNTSFIPVQTIGYWIPLSKQVLEDSPTLAATVNGELLWGLGLREEDQLLNGDGTAYSLDGLIQNATAWANESPNVSSEIDVIRSAIKQVRKADFNPSAIILNPDDWYDIETRKAGASDDAYAAGQPKASGSTLWGLPVVESNSIASGTFLVGDFPRAGVLFEREQATVEIARHDDTNFQKNMLTLRVSERVAWVTTNSLALVTGSL